MRRLAFLTLFALLNLNELVYAVKEQGHYTVIAPGTLHPERKYNVAVAVHHTKEPATLKVGIVGPSFNDVKTVELQPDELKNIEFNVPKLEKADYKLTAEGVSGLIFKNTTKLNFQVVEIYTKILTDKPKYKPGDVVNFRVLFLDENLKPGEAEADAVIWFEDGKHNRIKEYRNLEVVNGVYTGQFQISDNPVLGTWRLSVKNGERHSSETNFEVKKFALPKYNIQIFSTNSVSIRDGDVHVVVKTNYTYGKPVDGKATVILELPHPHLYYHKNNVETMLVKSADLVNGKAKFDFNVQSLKHWVRDKEGPTSFSITATVEENFTGVKLNGSSGVLVHPYRYVMTCVTHETCRIFHAEDETELVVQVMQVDGTPVTNTKSIAKLHFTEELANSYRRSPAVPRRRTTPKPQIETETHTYEAHLNDTGFAHFKVQLPELELFENYIHFYGVEMEYIDEKRKIAHLHQYRKPKIINPKPQPKDYFKLDVNTGNKLAANLNETVVITVNSSEPLTYLIWNIIGRGNILKHERIEVPNNSKVYNITFKPTFAMSPYAKIYVYYVDEHDEFHYSETTVDVEIELPNKIEITVPAEVKPGKEVAFRIKTAPNSFVALTAVDQSVLQLGDSNGIKANEFKEHLGRYGTNTPWQGGYSHYPGDSAGVVTLTGADYFYSHEKPIYYRPGFSGSLAQYLIRDNTEEKPEIKELPFSFYGMNSPYPLSPVYKNIAKTWIFANIENTQIDEFTWFKEIPDTTTSWILTGFSLNPNKGLGVTKNPINIKSFRPFFVALRLPYSVKRGEVFNVPALVFNYLDKDLDVEVTLDNSEGEYEFTEVTNEVIDTPKRSKTVRVPASSSAGVSFMLRPKVIGNIMLKYTANSPIAGDAIHKALKVVPEGVTEYANRAYFVNLKNTPEFKESFDLVFPSEVVPDSEHIEFTVIEDLLGPLLSNLDHLVRIPTGCAEQTISSLVPNYMVLRYLKSLNKSTPAIESKILHNLESGYQRLLSYRLDDGSFISCSLTNNLEKPVKGSTWFTAYAIRSLYQAKRHIKIDEEVIIKGLRYLTRQQTDNGTFLENNDFFYYPYRHHITLTASVLLTFIEAEEFATPFHQLVIDEGVKYILDNIEKESNLHVKAMATYVLHKSKHPKGSEQLANLKSLAQTDTDRMWWSQEKERSIHWWRWSYSSDVEITSYILLTLLDSGKEAVDSVLPIINWLVGQRNSYGGFSSTQDTVVGLQELIKFAQFAEYEATVMDIKVSAKGAQEKHETIKVNEDNGLLLQSVELPHKTLGVDFNAKGKGVALVQISYQYNVLEKEPKPAFSIKTVINKDTPIFKLEMDVCVEYTGEKVASNMALLEISLPSGYVADVECFEHIEAVPHVRFIESKELDTLIVVYFDTLRKGEEHCLPVEALRQFPVALQKPASIVIYDYYDRTKKATEFYEAALKMCDICEEDEEYKNACS